MNEMIMSIQHLRKQYEDGNDIILPDFNLEINDEDFISILGPSGCGKSTLIRCIAGLEQYEGTITLEGKNVTSPGPDRIMVFQDFNQVFPWKTALQNIAYALKINGVKKKEEREKRAAEFLEKVGLLEYKDYYPHQLSGGMKQRVAIAKGLALGSKIILMDEPFAALDAITRNQMQTELLRIKEKVHMTVLFITHNIQEAITLGNRIIVMDKNGNIREEITNPLEKPVSPATVGYGDLWEHLNNLLIQES